MKGFATVKGQWEEPVIVTINGKEYSTQLYDSVQRFIPQSAVEFIVNQTMNTFVLNELAVAVLKKEVSIEDYIDFETMHGCSVGKVCDSIDSIIGMNDHIFPGKVEDYFDLHNPLWDEDFVPPKLIASV